MGNLDDREKGKFMSLPSSSQCFFSSYNIILREIKILKTHIQKYISGSHQEITYQCCVTTQ